MTAGRVVVVLGYSRAGEPGLHPVCAARLETAAGLATGADVVVLSGWARRRRAQSEAELMEEAWSMPVAELVIDPDARTTVGNAANAMNDVLRVGAREVVVVTSAWHAARATAAFRWLLRGTGTRVSAVTAPGVSPRATLRELAVWPLLPLQLWSAGRRRTGDAWPQAPG